VILSEFPVGIIVTHNEWGHALVDEVESTVGGESGLRAVEVNPTKTGLERPSDIPATTVIFWFVDAPGSSAERAVNKIKQPGDHVITGFSMPMLLSFATKRHNMNSDTLITACRDALERGNICL